MKLKNKLLLAAMLCAAAGASPLALADTFEPLANDVPMGAPVTLAQAQTVLAKAEAEAKKRHWSMAIVVMEPSGSLVAFERLDGTQYASITVAQAKARTAATFRRPTKAFLTALAAGHMNVLTVPGVITAEGGIPLMENGKLIGSIGVSGGSDPQDGLIAQFGADAIK